MSPPADGPASKPPGAQRLAPRTPVRLRVNYERMNSFFADYTKNISRGGTFIKTDRPLDIGTRCAFAVGLPALSEPLLLEGEVAWILPLEAAQQRNEDAGMGVRFIFKSAAAQRDFETLVERLMADSLGPDVTASLLKK
jgi:type IV pilus assembly protein PilZ